MISEAEVTGHYEKRDLCSQIITSLRLAGIEKPTPQDLSEVDEFHIGGIDATRFVSAALSPTPSGKILDIGCGIGGPARFIALDIGCHVTGIDLTESFVETGNQLSRLVGLEDQVMLNTGNALALPFGENEFDAAFMIHVGMNVADKNQLISNEAARVIKPGGHFVIYDVMQMQDVTLPYPLPWAETEKTSAVSSPKYIWTRWLDLDLLPNHPRTNVISPCSFLINHEKGAGNQPPALGLHLVMGVTTPQKIQNVHQQIRQGVLAPLIITASRELAS